MMSPEEMLGALILAGRRVDRMRDALLFDGSLEIREVQGLAEQHFLAALSHLRICAATLNRAAEHFDLDGIEPLRRSQLIEEVERSMVATAVIDLHDIVALSNRATLLRDRLLAIATRIEHIRVDVVFGVDPIGSQRPHLVDDLCPMSAPNTRPHRIAWVRAHLDLEIAVGHLELAQFTMKTAALSCA